MKKILNLTQHAATQEQIEAGVYEPEDKTEVQNLLTFDTLPTSQDVWTRANKLAKLAAREGATAVMIGGAPYLMGPLDSALEDEGIHSFYAFSIRESVDVHQPDGSIKKTMVFKHAGFVQNYEM